MTNPEWGWRDVAIFVGLLVPSLLAAAAITFVMVVVAKPLKDSASMLLMGVLWAAWLGALAVWLRTSYGLDFWSALAWVRPGRNVLAYFVAGPVLAIAVNAVGLLLRAPMSLDMPIEKLLKGPLSIALFGVFAVVIAPVCEELTFRGFLLPVMIRSLGPWPGIAATALPFALLHGAEYAWTWQYIVLIALAGFAFGTVRHLTGSTRASAFMHAGYNLTFMAALLAR